MDPIRTPWSDINHRGPAPDIGDLPCWRQVDGGRSAILSVWKFTDDERRRIAKGANVVLGIHGMEPIPPVSLTVREVDERGDFVYADRVPGPPDPPRPEKRTEVG